MPRYRPVIAIQYLTDKTVGKSESGLPSRPFAAIKSTPFRVIRLCSRKQNLLVNFARSRCSTSKPKLKKWRDFEVVFASGRDVIVEGKLGPDGSIAATQVLTSCPSKYKPKRSQ